MMFARSRRCYRTQALIGGLGLALLVVFAACSDSTSRVAGPAPDTPPTLEISDAAHGGSTDGFYFLAPLVSSPSYSGTFDATLSPTVHICEGATVSCGGDEVALFTTETGPGSETVRVDETEEHYVVNWHTDGFELASGETYRISVRVAGTLLGYADVMPASNGAEMKNIDGAENIPLKDGRTLPVKFRIETGTVFPVGSSGGTITAEDGAVVLEIPEGALSEEVGITIESGGSVASGVGLVAGTVYDFQPDGLQFSEPASLTLAFSLPDGLSASDVAILDELESGEWNELVSSVDASASTVTAPIDGFSRKGVGKRAEAVEVEPAAAQLDLTDNTTAQFSATVLDATAAELTKRKVRWSVGDEEVATVDKDGLVTAVGDGTTYVEAQAGQASGRADVTVGANEPPTAQITSPTDGATFDEGETITFEGSGSDPEDGTLTGASLVWTSDVDGQVGTGTSFSASLSIGSHTLTLTATDSDGETGTATVSVTVDPASTSTSDIAFAFARDGSIYTIDRDGTNANQLTSSFTGFPAYTKWSPDGSKIAFIGDGDVYVVNPDGTGLKQVTDHGSVTDALAWSPDGLQLIFESGLSGSDEFWVTTLDDPNGQRVTAFGGNGITGVDWGSGKIVFSHFNLIYTLPVSKLDGQVLPDISDATLIEDENGDFIAGKNPVWSPDGNRIAFVADDGLDHDVFVMDANGSNIAGVGFTGARSSPTWSPDGSAILSSADPDGTFGGAANLYVASLSGGLPVQPVQITSEFSARDLHPHWNPTWSEPDSP